MKASDGEVARASASSVQRGNGFQDAAASGLRNAGYHVVGETLLGHKRVDMIARERRLGGEWVIAVEAKGWGRALSSNHLQAIWADYEPLYNQSLVHEILVVADRGYTPAGRNYAASRPGLTIITPADLTPAGGDFTAYLESLYADFYNSDDRVAQY